MLGEYLRDRIMRTATRSFTSVVIINSDNPVTSEIRREVEGTLENPKSITYITDNHEITITDNGEQATAINKTSFTQRRTVHEKLNVMDNTAVMAIHSSEKKPSETWIFATHRRNKKLFQKYPPDLERIKGILGIRPPST